MKVNYPLFTTQEFHSISRRFSTGLCTSCVICVIQEIVYHADMTAKKKRKRNGTGKWVNFRTDHETAARIRLHKIRKNLPDLPSAVKDKFSDVPLES